MDERILICFAHECFVQRNPHENPEGIELLRSLFSGTIRGVLRFY